MDCTERSKSCFIRACVVYGAFVARVILLWDLRFGVVLGLERQGLGQGMGQGRVVGQFACSQQLAHLSEVWMGGVGVVWGICLGLASLLAVVGRLWQLQ